MSDNSNANTPKFATQLLSQQDVKEQYGIKKTQYFELGKDGGEIPTVTCRKRGKRMQRCDIDAWIAKKKATDKK